MELLSIVQLECCEKVCRSRALVFIIICFVSQIRGEKNMKTTTTTKTRRTSSKIKEFHLIAYTRSGWIFLLLFFFYDRSKWFYGQLYTKHKFYQSVRIKNSSFGAELGTKNLVCSDIEIQRNTVHGMCLSRGENIKNCN